MPKDESSTPQYLEVIMKVGSDARLVNCCFSFSLQQADCQWILWVGVCRFYKGLVPLWARQIPYTMMKFACFERTVEALYKYVVPKPRAECSKPEQLVVTFAAGYIGESQLDSQTVLLCWSC